MAEWCDSTNFYMPCARMQGHTGDHINGDLAWSDPFVTKSSGERQEFNGGGVRDKQNGKPRFDLLMPERVPFDQQYLTRVAALMERGAEHYGDRNWEQMQDEEALARFRSSAFRHFMQWMTGETDEDHAAAIFFNVQGAEYVKGRIQGEW